MGPSPGCHCPSDSGRGLDQVVQRGPTKACPPVPRAEGAAYITPSDRSVFSAPPRLWGAAVPPAMSERPRHGLSALDTRVNIPQPPTPLKDLQLWATLSKQLEVIKRATERQVCFPLVEKLLNAF